MSASTRPPHGLPSLGLPLLLAGGLALAGCRSPLPNRDPVGEPFPTVTGTSLAGEEVRLPPGEPASEAGGRR